MADSKSRNISNLPIAIPDVPDAVTIASATDVGTGRAFNNGAATVTFSPTTGGLPSSYAITTTPSTTTTNATSSPVTITGLASATSYTATVTPSNVSATGPAATSSTFTATTVPQAPTIGTFTDGGTGTSGTLSFTAGATGGSAITAYKYSTDGTNYTTASGTTSPLSIAGLTPATYTFRLRATNANGDSADSGTVSGTVIQPTAFESIATATGTGSSGTITFSSIPSTYQHLQLRWMARSTAAVANGTVNIQFNGDTASNYTTHGLYGDGSAASAYGFANQTSSQPGGCPGANITANIMAVGIVDIHDYTSTTKNKTIRSFSGNDRNTTGSELYLVSGLWRSTSAVTSLTVFLSSSQNFSTNTTFALYGIKGA